ncbi:hypothetical protein HK098_004955 [Nowakowskiella sp. JEL0407]|nr:hypothetical protein HK098_004955 [Nowakowskiella sp. JEL0407]
MNPLRKSVRLIAKNSPQVSKTLRSISTNSANKRPKTPLENSKSKQIRKKVSQKSETPTAEIESDNSEELPVTDGLQRCKWVEICGGKDHTSSTYQLHSTYHDTEWGPSKPNLSDRYLFEMLTLESAQAGLSWTTILQKRESYRKNYNNFDVEAVSRFDNEKVEGMMTEDSGIVRHRQKINASISNAVQFLKVSKEFEGFDNYLGTFLPRELLAGQKGFEITLSNGEKVFSIAKTEDMTETEVSRNLSKDMKKRGFKFFGPVIAYAYLQAVGLVHDHDENCFKYFQNL